MPNRLGGMIERVSDMIHLKTEYGNFNLTGMAKKY
jgi:hypothetical protein